MVNLSKQLPGGLLAFIKTQLNFCVYAALKVTFLLLFPVAVSMTAFAQAPTITNFSPTQGCQGMTININGTDFTGATSVTIGGTTASFIVVNSTRIQAYLGYGSSGAVVVTTAGGSASRAGFYYQPLNRVITDFGGYWSSTLISPSSTKPDSSHNLLAFRYNNVIYSTGANDARLSANGISFTPSSYRALPVAGISGNNPGGSVYLALAKKVDGSATVANPVAVSSMTLSTALTDGIRGLDLGTGFTNLPSSANLTFNVYSIDTNRIADAEPDFILTQIAQPVSGNDIFSLVDSTGAVVGNTFTQNMTLLNSFGTYDLDLFNLTPSTPFNTATAYSAASTNTNREIRLVAIKLSDFGINSTNYAQVKKLKIAPSTNSDYAFIAYNTNSLNLPPNVTQNSTNTNTTVCSGGISAMAVIATAAAGGTLSYSWEVSTNSGGSWSPVVDGGGVSGATTNRLFITGPTNGHQYRAIVTESLSNLSSVSDVFTITVSSPAAPSAVSASGGASVCRYTAVRLTSSVTGGSNLYYQWQSSTALAGTYTDITDAGLSAYLPPVSATGTMYYRVRVSSGSGCAGSVTSASQTVTVTGISTTAGAENCGTASLVLSAGATSGTIDWYTADAGGSSLFTGTSYTTPVLTASKTYYVASSGCAGALRLPVTATIHPSGLWLGGASGDWNLAGNWCGGIPTSATNVIIPSGASVSIASANAVANTVNINAGGILTMTGTNNLDITASGSFINNGTFTATGSTGTVNFLGNGTISGTTIFNNIDTYGALNFGTASTVSGIFTIQTGGSVTGNGPFYSCPSSVLSYKPGSVFNRGLEWSGTSSGAGYPANVYIQNNSTINFPIAGNGYICNDLQIDSGSSLLQDHSGGSAALRVGRNVTLNGTLSLGSSAGGDIYVGGNWVRNSGGIFNANDRAVTFDGPANFSGNGSSMSTITAPASAAKDNEGGFGGEKFAHLWVNKSNATDSVVLLSNITITRELGFTKGVFSLRNNDVTLVSNSTRTADIAPVTSIADITVRYSGTGGFVVQRFIQNPTSTRSWRLLTAPVQGATAQSVNEAWQSGVVNPDRSDPNAAGGVYNPWPGYGTHITGPGGAYSAVNGFDHGTNSASILYANTGLTTWSYPSSTISTKVTDQQGWMLFIRGDRGFTIGNQYVPAQNTVLEPKGRIHVGDVSIPVTTGKQVIANPYASSISLMNVDIAGTLGKNSTYYMWDPKMFTSFTQPGKWVTFTGVGTGFVQTTSESPYTTDGNIESGQAFVVDAAATGTITFHESDKKQLSSSLVGIANATGARPGGSRYALLRSDIYVNNAGEYKVTDGVLNIFSSDYANEVTAEDATKMITFNTKESLSILRNDTVRMAIEKRKEIQDKDTITFSMSKFNEMPYQFRFTAGDFAQGINAYLEDKFTGTSIPVNTEGTTVVDFTITSNPLSKAEDRFRIVFKNSFTVLPVSFTTIKAARINDNILVEWGVENEVNISDYAVERSFDGRNFEAKHIVSASGSRTYTAADEGAASAIYYRIAARDKAGLLKYSRIASVNPVAASDDFVIYPNPVTDGVITYSLKNIQGGIYYLNLFDNTGKKIITRQINHPGGTITKELPLSNSIAKGIYYIEIRGEGFSTKEKLIVE